MKIFYITSVLGNRGGSEIYCKDLIQELVRRDHEIVVATTSPYEIDGTKTIHLPTYGHHALHKFEAPIFSRKVLEEAFKFKPDLVQSHSNSFMGMIGHQIKNKLKIPHLLLIELISSQNQNVHT